MIGRRTFMAGIAAVWVARRAAEAQPRAEPPRIAILHPTGRHAPFEAFRTALNNLGWIQERTVVLDYRVSGETLDRLAEVAEIVRSKPDVIVTGITAAAITMKPATSTIPIVMAVSLDPVGHGIVKSLSRPGGNITGQAIFAPEFSSKRLELLKETFPNATQVAIFWSRATPSVTEKYLRQSEAAGRSLGLALKAIEVIQSDGLEAAFRRARAMRAEVVVTIQSALFFAAAKTIADLAMKYQLSVISSESGFAEQDGLMNYGDSIVDAWRRAAVQVDKILKGAKPGDMPVEQPTKFELAINLKTARALGLTIPPSLLLRADQVIE